MLVRGTVVGSITMTCDVGDVVGFTVLAVVVAAAAAGGGGVSGRGRSRDVSCHELLACRCLELHSTPDCLEHSVCDKRCPGGTRVLAGGCALQLCVWWLQGDVGNGEDVPQA